MCALCCMLPTYQNLVRLPLFPRNAVICCVLALGVNSVCMRVSIYEWISFEFCMCMFEVGRPILNVHVYALEVIFACTHTGMRSCRSGSKPQSKGWRFQIWNYATIGH